MKAMRLVVLVLAIGLALAGCAAPAAPTAAPTAPPPPTPTTAAVAPTAAPVVAATTAPTTAPTAAPTSAPTAAAILADADPQLAAIYRDVVQKEMPGVPYSLLEGAKKEGKVMFYHIRLPAAHKALVEAFKQRFPFLQVEEYENSGTGLFERFMTEKRGGINSADIFQTSAPALMRQAIGEGYIDTYKSVAESAFPPGSYESGKWYALAYVTKLVYMYNTRLVTEEEAKLLAKYDGLWDAKFAGKPIVIVPPSSASGSQLHFYYLEKTFTQSSWAKIKAMSPKFLDVTPAAEAVGRGEAAITPTTEGAALVVWDSGAPVRWTLPQPALVDYDPQAIVSKAPHPNAARLLQEFTLSKAGQSLIAANAYPSVRADVGDLRKVAKEAWFMRDVKTYAIDQADFDANATRIVDDWKKVFGR